MSTRDVGNPENLNVDKVHESQSKQERRLKTDYETRLNFISEIKYAALTRWPPKGTKEPSDADLCYSIEHSFTY